MLQTELDARGLQVCACESLSRPLACFAGDAFLHPVHPAIPSVLALLHLFSVFSSLPAVGWAKAGVSVVEPSCPPFVLCALRPPPPPVALRETLFRAGSGRRGGGKNGVRWAVLGAGGRRRSRQSAGGKEADIECRSGEREAAARREPRPPILSILLSRPFTALLARPRGSPKRDPSARLSPRSG